MGHSRTIAIVIAYFTFAITAKGGDLSHAQFIWDFFKASFDERHNLVTAPFAVRMGMTLMTGAVNDRYTQRQLRNKLHLQDSVAKTSESYRRQLAALSRTGDIRIGTKVIAFGTDDFNSAFLAGSRYFNASIEKHTRLNVAHVNSVANGWAKLVTSGMVQNVLKSKDLESNTRLLLLNAIAFRGQWKHPFDVDKTKEEIFHTGDEAIRYHTEMMNLPATVLQTGVYEPLKAVAVELPFRDGTDLSLLVIMPQQLHGNATQIVQNLNQSSFEDLLSGLQPTKIGVKLPKLSFSNTVDVNAVLRNLALNVPFEWSVFQVFKNERLVLDQVKHGVSIEFDEKGARTVFDFSGTNTQSVFSANRPFIYVVIKRSTQFPLFLGNFARSAGSASSTFFKQVNNS
ncbi:alpha-2-antiplasmin-like [Sabethes cyaneus]|uniref:alpha-2-antiplasmin-like n=1 Tax=Sabethes cyaneus TaxID=53552 RepID=UPI00237EBE5A|nr:alpha-2-antiplasmin-like [Sabethes cyaneus]